MSEDRASRQDVTKVAVYGDRGTTATSSGSLETESVSTESSSGFGSDDGGSLAGMCPRASCRERPLADPSLFIVAVRVRHSSSHSDLAALALSFEAFT